MSLLFFLAPSAWAAEPFPIAPGLSWEVSEHRFAGGTRAVGRARLQGRPVHGLVRVAGKGSDGKLRWVQGDLPAPSRWSSTVPAEQAASGVRAALGPGPEPRVQEVWLARDGDLVPAYAIDALAWGWLSSGPSTWRVWVDARTGQPLRADKTSREEGPLGDIYPTNPVRSELQRVELPNLTSAISLVGSQVFTSSCDEWVVSESLFGLTQCNSRSTHAEADSAGNFLFLQEPFSFDDPAAEVHVYYHVDQMSTWLAERFGISLPYAPIQALTNFQWANAMFGDFDGDSVPDVSFGQSEENGIDLAYDADVVYHELGHAVVALLAPELPFLRGDEYGLEWAPGAVNEGAADVLSMVLTGDPQVGEYAGQAFGDPAIRDLSEPRRCPDDLQGEVHTDGEILGSLGWRLIADERVGPEIVAEWLVGALPLWGPQTDWPAVGRSLRLSADDLLDAGALSPEGHAAILQALAEWNLEECGRVVPLVEGAPHTRLLVTGGLQGKLERLPAGTQLSLLVPEDAVAVHLQVHSFRGADGMGFALMGRSEKPVQHEWTEIALIGLGFAVPAVFDWQLPDLSEPGVITLVPGGEPPLVPGETLYLSLASDNLGTLTPFDFAFGEVVLSAEIERAVPEAQRQRADKGCGCASSGAGPGLLGLLLAISGVRRRQRWS